VADHLFFNKMDDLKSADKFGPTVASHRANDVFIDRQRHSLHFLGSDITVCRVSQSF
jgi:hypothetical protein